MDYESDEEVRNREEKKDVRSAMWCWTRYRGRDETWATIANDINSQGGCEALCYQREICETTGRIHLQGFVRFSTRKRWRTVQALGLYGSFRVAKGSSRDNLRYCSKGDTWDGDLLFRFRRGVFPESRGRETELDRIVELIRLGRGLRVIAREFPVGYIRNCNGIARCIEMHKEVGGPREITVVFIAGKTGTGKTKWCYDYCKEHSINLYSVPQPGKKGGRLWFDGYSGQKAILFDDFDSESIGPCKWKNLLDVYPLQVDCKGSFKDAEWNFVFITSNEYWCDWFDYFGCVHQDAVARRMDNRFVSNEQYFSLSFDLELITRKPL